MSLALLVSEIGAQRLCIVSAYLPAIDLENFKSTHLGSQIDLTLERNFPMHI